MAITTENCGAVILAGGQSRRMGQCKALLELGGETLIARLSRQLSGFSELWISANDAAVAAGLRGQLIKDLRPGLGPLAGLQTALSATERQALLCVSCDLPLFTASGAAALLRAFPSGASAAVCRDSSGRIHPLCGVYARSALPVLERRLAAGELRMLSLLEELDAVYLDGVLPDSMLVNVNTPEAVMQVQSMLLPPR